MIEAMSCFGRPWPRRPFRVAAVLAALVVAPAVPLGAQSPKIVQPGAPGQPTREVSVDEAVDESGVRHTAADARFMQGMIGHHAQAVEMVALVATRSHNKDLERLAQRIDASQRDEMAMMRDWLERRGEPLPDAHAHHGAHRMPGMLTDAQMTALAAATGTAFDRLFLEGMIQHHRGALDMVETLLADPDTAEDPMLSDFASSVTADQAAEILRMQSILSEL